MSTTQLLAPNVTAQHWADPSHPDDRPFIRRYIFSPIRAIRMIAHSSEGTSSRPITRRSETNSCL
jgi:hypothetical protein